MVRLLRAALILMFTIASVATAAAGLHHNTHTPSLMHASHHTGIGDGSRADLGQCCLPMGEHCTPSYVCPVDLRPLNVATATRHVPPGVDSPLAGLAVETLTPPPRV
jgi:hypothetical protein